MSSFLDIPLYRLSFSSCSNDMFNELSSAAVLVSFQAYFTGGAFLPFERYRKMNVAYG